MNLNQLIFQSIYNLSHQSLVLDYGAIFIADYLQYILGFVLLILFFYPHTQRQKNRPMIILAVISSFTARFIVKNFILFFYNASRPFIALPTVHRLVTVSVSENFESFPSGHTIFFFAMATTIYLWNKKLGSWYLVCALLIGLARIYCGVHWPIDILGGVILGIMTGWSIQKLYLSFSSRE